MNRIIIVILIALTTFINPAATLAATITGYVTDEASGEPLPVATVIVQDENRGTTTNLDGYFVIDFIDPGTYILEVSYMGYNSAEFKIEAFAGYSKPITVEISRGSMELEEVTVVVQQRNTALDRQAPVMSAVPIDGNILRTMSSLGGEMDVLRALQTIPGVKSSSDISSALIVRGGSPDQTLILMDHNVVYNPTHLFGIFSTFNADAVKHLDLMKGGFPAAYGGRSGSVLEIIGNEGNRKKREGMISIGIVSARGSLEGPLWNKRGSYHFALRRTYMDPILDALRDPGTLDLPGYYFYDSNGKVNFDLSDRTTLTLAGYWGNDRMAAELGPLDSRINLNLSWGNRTISTRLRHALGRNMFFSAVASISRYRSKWDFSNSGILIDKARNRLYDYSFKSDLEFLAAPNHKMKAGFWVRQYDLFYHEFSDDLEFVTMDEQANNYSIFIQDRWRMSPFIELQLGLRGYYHQAGDQFALDPRLTVVYHYDTRLRFKVAGGRYSQFINLISFGEVFTAFDIWVPIDETMDASYSDQAIVGFEWDRSDGLEFTLEAYLTDMHNVAILDPSTDEVNNADQAFLQGDGIAYGMELMLRRMKGRLNGWLGYSLSLTKRQFEESTINQGNIYYPKWDRRHDFIVVGSYKLSRGWDLNGSWRYNTGQGFTEAIGKYTGRFGGINIDQEGDYGRTILWGSKNNYRFPADHRLDITASYNHLFLGKRSKFNISIYNVYSRHSYWLHNVDTSTEPTEVSDTKLLPILPLLSYEMRF